MSLAPAMTRNELAIHFSVDPRVMSRLLKDYGLAAKKYQQTEETKQKRIASLRRSWENNPEIRQKMNKTVKDVNARRAGKTYDDIYGEKASEIRSKLVESHTGLTQSEQTKEKRRKSLTGRKMLDSSKKLLSTSRKQGFEDGTIKLSPRTGCGRGGFKEDLGHYVRSTYEYYFAKMLKDNGIEYSYEPIRFNLIVNEQKTGYTPDFCINSLYYEIKNAYNVNDETFTDKLRALKEQHGIDVIVLIGPEFSLDQVIK